MWGDAFCSKGAAFKWSFCLTRRWCLLQVKEVFLSGVFVWQGTLEGVFHLSTPGWWQTLLSMARALCVTVTPWPGHKTLPSPDSAPAQQEQNPGLGWGKDWKPFFVIFKCFILPATIPAGTCGMRSQRQLLLSQPLQSGHTPLTSSCLPWATDKVDLIQL